MTTEQRNLAIAEQYLRAIENGVQGEDLAAFYTLDAVQEEFPNRLMPEGAQRDVSAVIEGAARGAQVMTAQRYEILNALAQGDQVVFEVHWTGTLAVPVGLLPAGGQMTARFVVFLEFRDCKIAAQRNYDCYDPF